MKMQGILVRSYEPTVNILKMKYLNKSQKGKCSIWKTSFSEGETNPFAPSMFIPHTSIALVKESRSAEEPK